MKEIFKRHPRYGEAPQDFSSLPDNVWIRCVRCRELLYAKEHEQALDVCPKCRYHSPVSARRRIDITLDPGSFVEVDAELRSADPLGFRSLDSDYGEKLPQYAEKSGTMDAFVYGTGRVDGQEIVLGVTEFAFCGGSMGAVVGEKVARATELAAEVGCPLVFVSSGGGARMQEGSISLLQMAKTVAALERFKRTNLPYLSIMVDPCLGGTTASYAMLGDVNIAEPGAYIGFAGRRVIEQTMRQKLPGDTATAEFLQRHGMIDLVVPRSELTPMLARLSHIYMASGGVNEGRRLVEQRA